MRKIVIPLFATILISIGIALIIGGVSPSSALTVNGTQVSQSTVDSDLASTTANPAYLCYLNASALIRSSGQSGLGSINGASTGTYSVSYVSNWLNQEITNQIIHDGVAKLDLSSQATENIAQARLDLLNSMNATLNQVAGTQYACVKSAQEILGSMPKGFVTRQVQAQSDSEVLLAREGGIQLDAASLQKFYSENSSTFDTICVSGVLSADQATAASIRAQIEAGADFATVAGQSSLDASKAKGGQLGCFSPNSGAYQSVIGDVGSLGVGAITQPLASSNKQYVILKVTSRTPTDFASIENAVRRTVLAKDASLAKGAASSLVKNATVTLNPRYGTWKKSATLTGVLPPPAPPSNSILNAKANLTVPSTG